MWFYIKNDVIEQGPLTLPKLWADEEGTQHPLVEMANKGHVDTVNALGWVEQNILPFTLTNYQEVLSYIHAINGNRVDSAPVVADKPLEVRREIRAKEITVEGNGLIDAQAGETERDRLMTVAEGIALMDTQVGHGGQPNPRDPRQDELLSIFTKVKQVKDTVKQAEIDLATHSSPETYTVTWPV